MSVLFVPPGLVFGSWAIRIPDIAQAANVSTTGIGFAFFVLALGTIAGMPAASAALVKLGTRPVTGIALSCIAAASLLLSSSGSAAVLFAAAFLLGITSGVYSVAINSVAAHSEMKLRRPVLPGCYAAYSLATLAASLLGGAAVGAGINPVAHMALINVMTIPVLASVALVDDAPRPDRFRVPRPTSKLGWIAAGSAFTALFGEGVVTDWSAYYLHSEILGSADARQAWGYSSFAICMVAGRALAGSFITRYGERTLLIAASTISIFGGLIVAAAPSLTTAIIGYALTGIGLSSLYPLTISIAARDAPSVRRQDAIASVSSIGYLGLLLGPAIVGLCSSLVTLRGALLILPALLIIVCLGISSLAPRTR